MNVREFAGKLLMFCGWFDVWYVGLDQHGRKLYKAEGWHDYATGALEVK